MRIFEFKEFTLDEAERVLYRDGTPIQLAPKIFDTLFVLVENHGRLVSKDRLMAEVWRETFVEENNLTQYIFVLRKTLGEDSNGHKFIETVPRRGYRFTADVREISSFLALPENSHPQNILPSELQNGIPAIEISNTQIPAIRTNETKTVSRNKFSLIFALLRERYALIVVGAILLTFLSLSFYFNRQWNKKNWSPENLKFKRLTESGNLFGAAISPDGNSLVYVVRGKRGEVRLKNIQTDSEIIVASSNDGGDFNSPRFSPDSNFIYYAYTERNTNGAVFQVPVLGGKPRKIAENLYSEFSVSPDGKQIAFPRKLDAEKKHVIIVTDTDGNGAGERVVAECSDPDYFALWGPAPAWSADGKRLIIVTGNFGSKQVGLLEINLESGAHHELKLQDKWLYISRIEQASDNALFIIGQKEPGEKAQLWQISLSGGAATRITNDSNEYDTLSLTKDSTRIVVTQSTENFHLWLYDRQTNQAKQLTFGANHREGLEGLSFTPDNRILYTMRGKNEYNIFSMNADGSDTRQLTKAAGHLNLQPAASPDGKLIAFISDRAGGEARIWLMNADGERARQLTPVSEDAKIVEGDPYFSPDGRWIYYTVSRNTHGSIYKISVDGSAPPLEVLPNASIPVVSPDEKQIAVNIFDDKAVKPWQLRIQSFDGTRDKFFDFPAAFLRACWLSNAPHTLVTASAELDGNNLWQTNLETGERRQITDFTADRIDRFDISKDGRFFVTARGQEVFDAVLIEH